MTLHKFLRWILLGSLGFIPPFVTDAHSRQKPDRILNEKKPNFTNPIDIDEAVHVDAAERAQDRLAADRDRLNSGEMSQADYEKSVASARQTAAEAAEKFPQSPAAQTSAARLYIQTGDFGRAVEHASKAHDLAPDDPFPLTTRGLAYFQTKDFPKAAADAQHALALDPKDPVAWSLFNLSKGWSPGGSNVGVPETAAHRGMETLSLPQNPHSQSALRPDDDPEVARYDTEVGRNYVRQVIATERAMRRKDFLSAYGLANQALTTYADNPRVLAARAISAWQLGDNRTAISDATLVLKADPKMYPMLIARAAAYNDSGRPSDALRDAEKAVAMAPRSAHALLEKAIAREALHDSSDSVLADFRHAAELDSRLNSDYQRALARLMPQKTPFPDAFVKETQSRGNENSINSRTASSSSRINWPVAGLGLAGLIILSMGSAFIIKRSLN